MFLVDVKSLQPFSVQINVSRTLPCSADEVMDGV